MAQQTMPTWILIEAYNQWAKEHGEPEVTKVSEMDCSVADELERAYICQYEGRNSTIIRL